MKNKLELYFKAAQSAKIGIWEVNIANNSLYWDAVTKSTHDVGESYVPNIENAILFYTEGKNREEIIAFSKKAMIDGLAFNRTFYYLRKT